MLEAVNNKRGNKSIKSRNNEIAEVIINTQCVYIGNQGNDRRGFPLISGKTGFKFVLQESPEVVPLKQNISGRILKVFFIFERDFKGSQADSSPSPGSVGCNETGKASSKPLCAPSLAEKYPNIVEVNGNYPYFVSNLLIIINYCLILHILLFWMACLGIPPSAKVLCLHV